MKGYLAKWIANVFLTVYACNFLKIVVGSLIGVNREQSLFSNYPKVFFVLVDYGSEYSLFSNFNLGRTILYSFSSSLLYQ